VRRSIRRVKGFIKVTKGCGAGNKRRQHWQCFRCENRTFLRHTCLTLQRAWISCLRLRSEYTVQLSTLTDPNGNSQNTCSYAGTFKNAQKIVSDLVARDEVRTKFSHSHCSSALSAPKNPVLPLSHMSVGDPWISLLFWPFKLNACVSLWSSRNKFKVVGTSSSLRNFK